LIAGLRGVGSWTEYKALLDKTIQYIVSAHRYKKYRLKEPLSKWFTFTDEAFLLLCLESYTSKWSYDYTAKFGTPAEKAALPAEAPEPLYTGRTRGTKRSWTKEGIERFNQLMIKVARDRQANAELADQNFMQYQKFLHGPREAAVAEEEDAPPQPQQRQIVYNDFDLQLLLEHAAGDNNVNDNANAHGDNEDDNEDDSEEDSEEDSDEESVDMDEEV
jgi:hypothetical protein